MGTYSDKQYKFKIAVLRSLHLLEISERIHKEKRYAVLSRIDELRIMEWHDTLENLADVPFELAEIIVGIFYKEFWI